MTNLLPSAVGMDGRVNLFVGNVSGSMLLLAEADEAISSCLTVSVGRT